MLHHLTHSFPTRRPPDLKGTLSRSGRRNTKSAACRPKSAALPGAMETCAATSAGASLRQSPTISALRPAVASDARRAVFSVGRRPDWRSAERRVGNEGGCTCGARWWRDNSKRKHRQVKDEG